MTLTHYGHVTVTDSFHLCRLSPRDDSKLSALVTDKKINDSSEC